MEPCEYATMPEHDACHDVLPSPRADTAKEEEEEEEEEEMEAMEEMEEERRRWEEDEKKSIAFRLEV